MYDNGIYEFLKQNMILKITVFVGILYQVPSNEMIYFVAVIVG